MPDFPWVTPNEFIRRFGSDIHAIDHRTPIGRWTELGRLDIVYKVSNNDTLVFRRRGVSRMPGVDEDPGRPPPPAHFFKSMSSQRTEVRREKKAREERHASMGSRRSSAFPSMAPQTSVSYLATTAADDDGGSSDIEVSEITDHQGYMMRVSGGSISHAGTTPYEHIDCTNVGSRSPSPMMVDPWPPSAHESSPTTPSNALPLTHSELPSLPPLWFPDSSLSASPGQPNAYAPSSSPTSLKHYSTPPSPTQSSQSSLCSQPASRPQKELPWHHGLYCIDVVDGFERMASRSLKGLSKAERFKAAFAGRRYAETTIRNAQNQWTRASNSTKEAALAAGCTTPGLWRVFSAQNPIKNKRSKF
jgi:hypothetical protein